MKIAIIGSTSHIAKGLMFFLKENESIELHCYARNLEKVAGFSNLINANNFVLKQFSEFHDDHLDAIINCIGISYSNDSRIFNDNVFNLTEKFDNLILDYIDKNQKTTYINFSSGAVYGTSYEQPADATTRTFIEVNNIRNEDYYRIAKLNSEAKHRSMNNYNILDLRIFGYYSRFIDLTKSYLMTDIISCIKEKRILKTNPNNIIRDYIHPSDLTNLVKACIEEKNLNQALDVKSIKPVSKFDILDFFKAKYGLNFKMTENYRCHSLTGEKLNYYSENNSIEILKYRPEFTSLECVEMETETMLTTL